MGTEEQRAHALRQREAYNTALLIHLDNGNMSNDCYLKEIICFVEEVAKYAKQFNIHLCFPHSIGHKNMNDLSQIVYFP